MRILMLTAAAFMAGCSMTQTEIVTADSYTGRTTLHLGTGGFGEDTLPGPKGKDGTVFAAKTRDTRDGQAQSFQTAASELTSVAKVWLIAGAFVDSLKAIAGMSATTTHAADGSVIRAVGPAAVPNGGTP